MAQAQAGTVDAVHALIAGVEERLRRQLRLERTNLLSALAEETPTAGAASAEAAAPPPPPIVFLVEEAAPAPAAESEAARRCPTCDRTFAPERLAIHIRCCARLQQQPEPAALQVQVEANAIRARARTRLAGAVALADGGVLLAKPSPRRGSRSQPPTDRPPERREPSPSEFVEREPRGRPRTESDGPGRAAMRHVAPLRIGSVGPEVVEEDDDGEDDLAVAVAAAKAGRAAKAPPPPPPPEDEDAGLDRSRQLVPPELLGDAIKEAQDRAVREAEEAAAALLGGQQLVACEVCGRKFASDTIARHEKVCRQQASQRSKRPPSESRLSRLRKKEEQEDGKGGGGGGGGVGGDPRRDRAVTTEALALPAWQQQQGEVQSALTAGRSARAGAGRATSTPPLRARRPTPQPAERASAPDPAAAMAATADAPADVPTAAPLPPRVAAADFFDAPSGRGGAASGRLSPGAPDDDAGPIAHEASVRAPRHPSAPARRRTTKTAAGGGGGGEPPAKVTEPSPPKAVPKRTGAPAKARPAAGRGRAMSPAKRSTR